MTTYPKTDDYDLEEDLTKLGTGEAMVTILSERGAPTPVVWTRLLPPASSMNAIDPVAVDTMAKESSLWATYSQTIDRESARELLLAKMTPAPPAAVAPPAAPDPAPAPPRPAKAKTQAAADESQVVSYLKSREGRSMVNTVARGVFGLLKRR